MFLLLNGPLGVGKSTLAEAWAESVSGCVSLDGDHLVAANPPADDELEHLHSTIALLVEHHRRFGYRHFVINHLWTAPEELEDLRRRLLAVEPDAEVVVLLLQLPETDHRRRVERRAEARAHVDLEWERRTMAEERARLSTTPDLGRPFDASAPPAELVARLRELLAP